MNRCFFRRCPEISFDPHVENVISKRFFTIPILYHNSVVSARDAKRVISKMYLFSSILQKIMIKFYKEENCFKKEWKKSDYKCLQIVKND